MTDETKEHFIADRLRALTTVFLTRRDDLTITETKQSTGLDIHIYIEREDKPMRLGFGAMLRGVSSPMTAENANKALGPTMGQFQGMRKFTYPVCLLLFTMRDERAYFSGSRNPSSPTPGPNSFTTTKRTASTSPTNSGLVQREVTTGEPATSVAG